MKDLCHTNYLGEAGATPCRPVTLLMPTLNTNFVERPEQSC